MGRMLFSRALIPTSGALASTERRRIRAFAMASVVMLVATAMVRLAAPSPFAPRVHVRWSEDVSEAQRTELERRFSLLRGRHREAGTWEYDLQDPAPSAVRELIANPSVADTHYLDRVSGAVAADAPPGTVRLAERRLAAWIHSPVFDWILCFWASSVIVSSVCLASAADARRP
jgi:hypothetical protein